MIYCYDLFIDNITYAILIIRCCAYYFFFSLLHLKNKTVLCYGKKKTHAYWFLVLKFLSIDRKKSRESDIFANLFSTLICMRSCWYIFLIIDFKLHRFQKLVQRACMLNVVLPFISEG